MLSRFTLAASLLAGLCLIADPALATEYKVGFVDVERVLEQAPQKEDAELRLEKEFAPRDRKLVAAQKEKTCSTRLSLQAFLKRSLLTTL